MNTHEPEQLDLLTTLDEDEGLIPWIDTLPCPPWGTQPSLVAAPGGAPETPRTRGAT